MDASWLSVSAIAIVIIMVVVAIFMWKIAKMLVIPIQILLFIALMFIAYKLLFTPDKLEKISDNVTSENIQEVVDKATDSANRLIEEGKKIAEKIPDGAVQAGKDAAVKAGKEALNSVLSGEKQEKAAEQPTEATQENATQENKE